MKYKMPTKSDLKGRSSTISNAFAISITPYIIPSEEAAEASYSLLQIQEGQCAYCLGEGNSKDHLKPLVKNGMPTGYITEIGNLVPCCSACNSSKGAKSFKKWYLSDKNVARLKNKGLSVSDMKKRFKIISEYERKIGNPIDYEKLVGTELWIQYQEHRKLLIEILNEEQKFCDRLSSIIAEKMQNNDYIPRLSPPQNIISFSEIAKKIAIYKKGSSDKKWKMKDQVLSFENEYIRVLRVDSSNKWISATEMEKQWGIIFEMKKSFSNLPNYKKLTSLGDIAVTPVRTGKNAGCYGLRFYKMKQNPDADFITEILNFIFKTQS